MADTPPTEDVKQEESEKKGKRNRKLGTWAIIGIIVGVFVIVGGAAGGYVLHLSNTSPEFCATCHIMLPNVTSYLTGQNLDHVHDEANVGCKDCHNYPVTAEVSSGVKYIFGAYEVDSGGNILPRTYGDDMCLKCHISKEFVAQQTDFLYRNPHDSHNGMLPCKTCHISHGAQIDYCGQCHDNGGQRMIGQPIEPRGTIK